MELWFSEMHTDNVKFSIKINEQLLSKKSDFQSIAVFDSPEFGKFFTLDDYIMITEKDEFIYHDMIVHIPMATNLNIKNVLVIGAGDGGTIRELCRYKNIEKIDVVEIDKLVVDVCLEYFPSTSCGFKDKRVNIFYEDGIKFVKDKAKSQKENYDLIIVDSTDPIGPGEGLFTKDFYNDCFNSLTKDGILVNQHESPYYEKDSEHMKRAHKRITETFPIAKVYQAHIPTYASGHWLFGFASKSFDPIKSMDSEKWNALGLKTRYYNTELHKACFALPNYVIDLLKDARK